MRTPLYVHQPHLAPVRIDPKTNEVFIPHRYRDGRFRVADPKHGRKRHHSENAIPVNTEAEARSYVEKGFLLRMRGKDTGQVNLIAASEIKL